MEEIWKDIKNFEGLYQVSNLGRVKSLDKYVNQFNGFNISKRFYKGKVLQPHVSNKGYLRVFLYNKEMKKNYSVHRLVAEAFIPNLDNLPQVNHKDENKLNNISSNLEWCSSKFNINYGNRNFKTSEKLKGIRKSEEHRKKLSLSAKKRKQTRDSKGRFQSKGE